MDSFPIAQQLPFPTQTLGRMQKLRKPRQRDSDGATVLKVHNEFVARQANIPGARRCFHHTSSPRRELRRACAHAVPQIKDGLPLDGRSAGAYSEGASTISS